MAKEALLAMNEPFVGYSVVKKYDDDVSFGSRISVSILRHSN